MEYTFSRCRLDTSSAILLSRTSPLQGGSSRSSCAAQGFSSRPTRGSQYVRKLLAASRTAKFRANAPSAGPLPRVNKASIDFREGGDHHQQLIQQTHRLEPLRTAVVHPLDADSLLGAILAAKAKLIVPVLVGPEAKIRAAADQIQVKMSKYEFVPTEHSHAAAAKAVELARDLKVEALMKGSLHTAEFMSAIVGEEKLRTDRRMSHVFAVDAPTYPRPLFITDAAINIYPTLEEKADIIQNAIQPAHALGMNCPKVAILSAVETVSPKIKSTLDAAVLCKMAERGQITGGILDGPLAFDNAVSEEAAKIKGIVSRVAGRADIFVVPDLDAGNMLAKQLEYLAGAQMAGLVLGARVPIVLTSRADKTPARLASCAIALLLARSDVRERAASVALVTNPSSVKSRRVRTSA
jgi:phosphate acetyltransferase